MRSRRVRSIALASVLALALASALVSPVAAENDVDDATEPTIHAAVDADGDATLSLVTVHDLADEDERRAFDSLADDEEARADLRDRFASRVAGVAESLGEDGESVIAAESVTVRSEGDRGIVVLAVTWDDLANVEDDTLTLTEPFASGFESERRLVVAGPDGSSVASATPEPTDEGDGQASWEADRSLEGFEVALSLEADGADASTGGGDSIPGFGLPVAVAAIGCVAGRYALAGRGDDV